MSRNTKGDPSFTSSLVRRLSDIPATFWLSVAVALTLPFFYTRLTSGRCTNNSRDEKGNGIWRVPYWMPRYGNSMFAYMIWLHGLRSVLIVEIGCLIQKD